jgi:putative ABC transport system substrate-binding protein
MPVIIGRRGLIAALGGAGAWPLAARAQQQSMPIVAFLSGGSADAFHDSAAAFGEGLSETGYIEGKNVMVDYRWANGEYNRLLALATELVRRKVAVIGTHTPVAALAAKEATTTIPIVFALGSDPVKDGLVTSLNRPGGNITGATFFSNLLDAKRLELFHELVPSAKVVGVLLNPKNSQAGLQTNNIVEAARAIGLGIVFEEASIENEIDAAIANINQRGATALVIMGDAFLLSQTNQISKLAIRYSLPTSGTSRWQAERGALMSYGAKSQLETFRQAGNYAGRILKGEKPADLPVQQPAKFELVINIKTAKMLHLDVPLGLSAAADDLIE